MQVRQLDGVLDDLDLLDEAPDVAIGDIGNLLEDQLLDFWADQLLENESGHRVHSGMIARTQECPLEGFRPLDHPFLVGSPQHDQTVVLEGLLDRHHLAALFIGSDIDNVEGFVQDHFLADAERLDLDRGLDIHPQLPAVGVDVDGAVLVDP